MIPLPLRILYVVLCFGLLFLVAKLEVERRQRFLSIPLRPGRPRTLETNMNELKFALEDKVRPEGATFTGKVVARAEYAYAEPSYLVRYINRDGDQKDAWFTESALTAS